MKKPFFNKFLVDQHENNQNKIEAAIKGGKPYKTLKYPSDSDETGTDI